jgi:predicted phosphate transport protein (TIGR00153 family)
MPFGFSLIPREQRFYDLFDETTAHLTQAAQKFRDMVSSFDNLATRSQEMKAEEEACDKLVGSIIEALDKTFITPMDREDIHKLATSLDDILDNMEETAHRLQVFRIQKPTPEAIEMARIIYECCTHLEQAIRLCRGLRKPDEIQTHLKEVGRLENEADRLYRKTDAELFSQNGTIDILTLIKWRELYAWLEDTVDACKDTAHVISEIVIKGS